MITAIDDVLHVLRHCHQRLTGLVDPADAARLSTQSYCDDWTIAQVASHLGSGAEIFGKFLAAGNSDAAPPGLDELKEIWARWEGKTPSKQASDMFASNAAFLDEVAALSAAQQQSWHIEMSGADTSLIEMLRERLAEVAVHSWDIAVVGDPRAALSPSATTVIIDDLAGVVKHIGQGSIDPSEVRITTDQPAREFDLRLAPDGAHLVLPDGSKNASGRLRLPAEAFTRLVYGRLDPTHTPTVGADNINLDTLRGAFQGL